MTDSPTADALRELTDRCIPGKTWCVEGAKLRDAVNAGRDTWLKQLVAKRSALVTGITRTSIMVALDRLAIHVTRCGREES